MKKQDDASLQKITMSFEGVEGIPDPGKIQLAGQWYFIAHTASSLVAYDHEASQYVPSISSSWTIDGLDYTFKIKQGLRFHDGALLTSRDVEASIKRLLVQKRVTHFPLWEFFSGCENIHSIEDPCEGIERLDDTTLRFRLVDRKDSFFLALSSPETSIWSYEDLVREEKTGIFKPTRFSGPYFVESSDTNGHTLRRNDNSVLVNAFPLAPQRIFAPRLTRTEIEKGVVQGTVDAFIGDYIPFNEIDWKKEMVRIHYTTPSSLIYLAKNRHQEGRGVIGKDLLKALWNSSPDENLLPATSFLPPGLLGILKEDEILACLPEKTSKRLRVVAPRFYFKDGFFDFVRQTAQSIGVAMEVSWVSAEDWLSLLAGEYKDDDWDFVASTYVASERYPAVQLRYLLHGKSLNSFDPFVIDQADSSESKQNEIRGFQTALLKKQYVIPFFFIRSHLVYCPHIDIGFQPTADAEIQLWRFQTSTSTK